VELPMDRFLNLVYFWAVQNATEETRRKFDAQIFRPLPGTVATAGPWTAENETKAFQSLSRALKSGAVQ
jgi:hypothetical protein